MLFDIGRDPRFAVFRAEDNMIMERRECCCHPGRMTDAKMHSMMWTVAGKGKISKWRLAMIIVATICRTITVSPSKIESSLRDEGKLFINQGPGLGKPRLP